MTSFTVDTGRQTHAVDVTERVEDALDLGTWQSVLLVERDGPRSRTVSVRVEGDG